MPVEQFDLNILMLLLLFRCHSHCWTNWKTGKTAEKLLQEMLATGEKVWPSLCGKKERLISFGK